MEANWGPVPTFLLDIEKEAREVRAEQKLGKIVQRLEKPRLHLETTNTKNRTATTTPAPIPPSAADKSDHAFISVLFNDQYFIVARQGIKDWKVLSRIPASFAPAVASVLETKQVSYPETQGYRKVLEDVRATCTRLQRENAQLKADLDNATSHAAANAVADPADKAPKFTLNDTVKECRKFLDTKLTTAPTKNDSPDVKWVERTISNRRKAINNFDYTTASNLTIELARKGVRLIDTADGTRWKIDVAHTLLQAAREEEEKKQGARIKELRRKESGEDSILHSIENLSKGMKCSTCMYYVAKVGPQNTIPISPRVGRCRRNAPTMSGWPVMFDSDFCGNHKLDESKI
ncbi:MAG: hypothetical protein KOO63_05770 [Bacteroidales bacterium]|nr:hypothetical protein [Candidatus Latescibacterota bacterium]